MQVDDWMSVGAAAVGVTVGSLLGYWVSLHRRRTPRELKQLEKARAHAAEHAAFVAMGTFVAIALVEDVTAWLRYEKPGFALVKYLFAAAIGITQYVFLRRVPTGEEATTH